MAASNVVLLKNSQTISSTTRLLISTTSCGQSYYTSRVNQCAITSIYWCQNKYHPVSELVFLVFGCIESSSSPTTHVSIVVATAVVLFNFNNNNTTIVVYQHPSHIL